MAEKTTSTASEAAVVKTPANAAAVEGTAGLQTQMGGQATTVSAMADATGGIEAGNLIIPDVDDDLFRFQSDETPLMDIMLKSKKVMVESPVVEHPMIDEERPTIKTNTVLTISNQETERAELPLPSKDQKNVRPYDTIITNDIDGYAPDGSTRTPGIPLMLFVESKAGNGNPMVRAINGVKTSKTNEDSCLVTIPEGTEFTILGNALYETQKWVQPSSMHPVTREVFLQKRGMTHIVSDYFNSQKKRIPFTDALIAEDEIRRFKLRGNRTLWAGVKGMLRVDTGELGVQHLYTTEGVRYQFLREMQHTGKWTFEEFIALTKLFKTGVDVPKGDGLVICGKNLLESIQCIDFSKHPEVCISTERNPFGWEVTKIHTTFCNLQFKHDPTLDRLGWSNSGALIAEGRTVHYERVGEHGYSEDMEDHEAKRSSTLVFDALVLKGSAHIWIDGEGTGKSANGVVVHQMHDSAEAPASPTSGTVYYLLRDCPAINKDARAGQMWKYTGSGYERYSGEIIVQPAA